MPHLRERHILPLLIKRLTFSPVLAIQGARQTGKSVLLRDILAKKFKRAKYVSFDSHAQSGFAQNNPETFLAGLQEFHPLIIDEAQKAPNIFDAVKLAIDTKRLPGRYILLGSTEFSRLSRIRESLTGRMGRIRIHPFTLAEIHNLPLRKLKLANLFASQTRITREQLFKHLRSGGMPGIFAVREANERIRLLQDWLDLSCQRDALQFEGVKIDPQLCLAILEQVAKLDEATEGKIAKALLKDPRKIKTHLKILEALFIVQKLPLHSTGSGKALYYLLDTSFASYFGASFHKCLLNLIKTELDALLACHDLPLTTMSYYKSPAGSPVHFIIENPHEMAAIKILPSEKLDLRELEILKSLQKKISGKKIFCYALGGERFSLKKEKIEIYPWEAIA